jgi:hypothetical protein
MASGGLPALAKLSVRFRAEWGGAEEVRTRVAPAFEAVAGTLTHLHLEMHKCDTRGRSDEVDVGYELGVAIGKLRRLKDLALDLSLGMAGSITPWPRACRQWGYQMSLFSRVCGSLALSPCCGAVLLPGFLPEDPGDQCRPGGEPAPPECAGFEPHPAVVVIDPWSLSKKPPAAGCRQPRNTCSPQNGRGKGLGELFPCSTCPHL